MGAEQGGGSLARRLATPAAAAGRDTADAGPVPPDAGLVTAELARPTPGRGSSVAELVRHDLVTSTLRLLHHEAAIRLGQSTDGSPTDTPGWDHEEVHQARVATRRWRSTLRTFGRVLEPEWSARLSVELFWLAALLGAVRDADVLLAALQRDLEELPPSDVEAGRRLLRRLAATRASEHRRLLVAMGQPRYAGLLRDLVVAADVPEVLTDAARPRSWRCRR